MKTPIRVFLYPVIAVAITALDLFTKYLVTANMKFGESVPIIGDLVRFSFTYNKGVTFGLLQGIPPVVLAIAALAALTLVVYLYLNITKYLKDGTPQEIARICIMAIVGGALGNIIDRFMNNMVVDFIDMGIGTTRWYTYNVGDTFVVVGAVTMAILFLFFEKKKTPVGEETPGKASNGNY